MSIARSSTIRRSPVHAGSAVRALPVAASRGQYGHGFVWRWGSDPIIEGQSPDAAFGIPPDTFYLLGHDGQSIAVIRSRQIAVVRLGLTPYADGYAPQGLIRAVLETKPGNVSGFTG